MGRTVLVIGGGVSGIQASLDLADRGFKVYLVERLPSIGGKLALLDKVFPMTDCAKTCTGSCSLCILVPRMVESAHHQNITLLTCSELKEVNGSVGNFTVKILRNPRYIKEERCINCGECIKKCPVEVPNEFDMNLGKRKAIYLPFPQAMPNVVTIDKENCLHFNDGECRICEEVCVTKAVSFNQKPEEITLNVDAIIVATGFDTFDPSKIEKYGYGRYKNVITAMELERLLSAYGPTGGRLLRLSNGEEPDTVAFILCVGSRDVRYGCSYCSSICCMYSVKMAVSLKQRKANREVYIFYIDLRAFGRGFQEFANMSKSVYGVKYIRSNPGEIRQNLVTGDLLVWYEDTTTRSIQNLKANLVVLCTASVPRPDTKELAKILGIDTDRYGFFKVRDEISHPIDTTVAGIFACGYCIGPKTGDIPDSIMQGIAAAARVAEIFKD